MKTPEEHLKQVVFRAQDDLREKYQKGQDEHGGQLWRKGLLTLIAKEIRHEAIDQVVYTDVLLAHLMEIRVLCGQGILHSPNPLNEKTFRRILEILDGEIQE